MGTWRVLAIPFPPCLSRKGLPRDSAGLRGWGAHGALQNPEGLRGALQGFRRRRITRDRPKWRFSSTGTRNMTFSIRVCALVMAFSSACRGKGLLKSPPGASKAPSGFQGSAQLLNLSKSNCFPLDFGEPPIQNNPGDRDGLGLITCDTRPVRSRKDTSHRQARGICHSRFEFERL